MLTTESSLARMFARRGAAFRTAIDRLFAELDLNAGQVAVLDSLWREDGRTQTEIARDLQVSAPTVNKMLRPMTEKGLVTAERCSHDSRSVRIRLTLKGHQLRSSVDECWARAEKRHFSSLTDIERLLLAQLLSKMS